MSDSTFVLAADGWAHITPCGEFPHAGAGVVQVIDRAACDAISAEFDDRKADANFPGILVDFEKHGRTFDLPLGSGGHVGAEFVGRKLREDERFGDERKIEM